MPPVQDRSSAIAETLEETRAIEARDGITPASLKGIKAALLRLAARPGLFPREAFPVPEKGGVFYTLHEPPDHRHALYMNLTAARRKAAPHCHGTWSVVVGIAGEETNRFYRRAGEALVPVTDELVRPGTGIAMMPDDIHDVAVSDAGPTLHLHLYGLSLGHFPELVFYDPASGVARQVPPPRPVTPP